MSILSKPWRVFSPALGQSLSFLTASNAQTLRASRMALYAHMHAELKANMHTIGARVNLSSYNSLSPLQGTQSFKSSLIMKLHQQLRDTVLSAPADNTNILLHFNSVALNWYSEVSVDPNKPINISDPNEEVWQPCSDNSHFMH